MAHMRTGRLATRLQTLEVDTERLSVPALHRVLTLVLPLLFAAGWDLFGLDYDLDEPLATAVTPRAMTGYCRLSRCACFCSQ